MQEHIHGSISIFIRMDRISFTPFAPCPFWRPGRKSSFPSSDREGREMSSITYVLPLLHLVLPREKSARSTLRAISACLADFATLAPVIYGIVNSQIRARRSLRFYDEVSVLDCTLLLATRALIELLTVKIFGYIHGSPDRRVKLSPCFARGVMILHIKISAVRISTQRQSVMIGDDFCLKRHFFKLVYNGKCFIYRWIWSVSLTNLLRS